LFKGQQNVEINHRYDVCEGRILTKIGRTTKNVFEILFFISYRVILEHQGILCTMELHWIEAILGVFVLW